jgi:hypothetical protein
VNTDGSYSATFFPGDTAGELYGGGTFDDVISQLKFAPTAVPSTDVNTLDDYEEGAFVATIVGDSTPGTGTYTSQAGRYTKIGRKVFFDIVIAWTAHDGTGGIRIDGLPFTSIAGSIRQVCNIFAESLTFSNSLAARVLANSTQIQLLTFSSGAAAAVVSMDSAATLYISGSYETLS